MSVSRFLQDHFGLLALAALVTGSLVNLALFVYAKRLIRQSNQTADAIQRTVMQGRALMLSDDQVVLVAARSDKDWRKTPALQATTRWRNHGERQALGVRVRSVILQHNSPDRQSGTIPGAAEAGGPDRSSTLQGVDKPPLGVFRNYGNVAPGQHCCDETWLEGLLWTSGYDRAPVVLIRSEIRYRDPLDPDREIEAIEFFKVDVRTAMPRGVSRPLEVVRIDPVELHQNSDETRKAPVLLSS